MLVPDGRCSHAAVVGACQFVSLKSAVCAEILVLRQQINVLRRKSPKRFAFGNVDRLVFVGLYRLVPGIVNALAIIRPETVIRWHRAGFRSFWRWKIETARRETEGAAGNPSADPGHEPRQPVLGRTPHPW
jgi:hypothetical protein